LKNDLELTEPKIDRNEKSQKKNKREEILRSKAEKGYAEVLADRTIEIKDEADFLAKIKLEKDSL